MSSYLALKIQYINKTNTHIHKVELKTLYFNFDSLFQKRFLRSIPWKRLTIEVLVLDELIFNYGLVNSRAVSQLTVRVTMPTVTYKLSSQ